MRLIKIGDIRVAQGDRAGALQAFKQSRSIFGKLVKRDASNAGWQHDLSISLMKIGDIRVAQGDRALRGRSMPAPEPARPWSCVTAEIEERR